MATAINTLGVAAEEYGVTALNTLVWVNTLGVSAGEYGSTALNMLGVAAEEHAIGLSSEEHGPPLSTHYELLLRSMRSQLSTRSELLLRSNRPASLNTLLLLL